MKVAAVAVAAALALTTASAASAADKVTLGKAVPNSFAFGTAEVGIQAKIFEQEGIDLEAILNAPRARSELIVTRL